jgi:hypothetical protein
MVSWFLAGTTKVDRQLIGGRALVTASAILYVLLVVIALANIEQPPS